MIDAVTRSGAPAAAADPHDLARVPLGVLPLALGTGAGSGGQNAIGTGVLGGMISATVLGIFFVPLFFVIVTRLFRRTGAMQFKPPASTPEAR